MNDEDSLLVARCLAGDSASFRPLVERYQRVLFSVALRMLGDREDAADAAQTAFLKAFEKLASYDPRHKFFSWLYRILVNECLNVKRARRETVELDDGVAATGGPLEELEIAERRARVQAAIVKLPSEQREVIVLRHFADLSYAEIAEALELPEKTVKSRLYDARQQLGQWLLGWDAES
jgi:RNA polymerase sigma-70 factor (ECF subfamily)